MKRITSILFGTFVALSCLAQRPDTVSIADIAPYVHTFNLENGKLKGEGADILISEIQESQFFLLGEYHYDSGISNLTEVLLPILADADYDHFAVEVGPYSAEKLTELGKEKNIEEALHGFYSDQLALTGRQPIPFFSGKEDAAFFETALDEGFDIWGLDQEYLGGFLFLFDELWQSAYQPNDLLSEYEAARERIKQFYINNAEDDENEVYNQLLADERLIKLMNKLAKKSCNGEDRVDEILRSSEIYRDWKGDLMENLEGRAALMKEHFREYYQCTRQREPKVFIKMGAMHTARGFTGNSCYELGNMVHELANMNGTNDLNVTFATRYYLDEETGEIGDNLTYESDWVRNMTPLLAQGQLDEWVLIDLRPIKKMWVNRERTMTYQLKYLLRNNDYIIIMPPLPEVTPNYVAVD
ncbi:hypothetical protein [Sanyastnella coralliicola]|uniref:hypothetical protein n=1 Tax=Sanyastnella coralliicola TaxID=3069118 RepID=UPI0027BAC493|nr:hypothetical protein [Longitalea sp. SCSIO 12813]